MVNTTFSTSINPELLDNLPIDLKREILETTAYLYPEFAQNLAVVSHDVQPWAERIIYRELYFSGHGQRFYHGGGASNKPTPLQKFKVALEARPPSFFAEYVRTLHFNGPCDVEDILPIIQVCTGVRNFGMYASLLSPKALEIVPIVHSLPLHTLFISNKNLAMLLSLDAPAPSDYEGATNSMENRTPEQNAAVTDTGIHAHGASGNATSKRPESEAFLAPLAQSSLYALKRLGLVDGFEYPAERFPVLTHLALVPDFEDKVIQHVKDSLENTRIESIVVMLNYINAPRQTRTLRTLRNITDPRLVQFTLSVSPSRYIEDDLWDLANEFPDEEPALAYLTEIPGPGILSFQESMELEKQTQSEESGIRLKEAETRSEEVETTPSEIEALPKELDAVPCC